MRFSKFEKILCMSTAEQKQELFKIVKAADEETTAKLIEMVQTLHLDAAEFSAEDLAEFNRRSDEHIKDPLSSIPWEESLGRIRNKLQK